jgi:ketopantoate reductase
MLQDLERGRTLEIDALVTAGQELGRLTGVQTDRAQSGSISTLLISLAKRGYRDAGV